MDGKLTRWLWIAGLLFASLLGVGIRRAVVTAQTSAAGAEILPFTLESALHFRRVEQVLDGGGLPSRDPAVGWPEGIEVWRTYSVFDEFLYAGLIRWFPAWMPRESAARWVAVLLFCAGIPLLGLWIATETRSRMAGWIAAMFGAVATACVVRSTGQELSRELLAIPLILGHWTADAAARQSGGRRRAARLLLSASALALALAAWDMTQFAVVLWLGWTAWEWIRTGRADRVALLVHLAALAAVGVAHPYLRVRLWPLSPLMIGGWLLAGAMCAAGPAARTRARRLGLAVAAAAVAAATAALLNRAYGGAYGHFFDLVWAKLAFLNRKPADPSLLRFSQRILWTPALHSASPAWFFLLFPACLWLTFFVLPLYWFAKSKDFEVCFLHRITFLFGVSLVSFILFVRFHVFLGLAVAAVLGAGWAMPLGPVRRAILRTATVVCLLVETGAVLADPARWGRPNVYYRELAECADWLRSEVAPRAVLSNFGPACTWLTRGGCPIVLHPKFETERARRRVESYAAALFRGSEETFRRWMEEREVDVYVHGLGEFSDVKPEWQMRYFADALHPPAEVAARMFEERPRDLRWFFPRWENRKYRVFERITREEEQTALTIVGFAEQALEEGKLEDAEAFASGALRHDPKSPEALRILTHAHNLRRAGFGGGAPVAEPAP
jgi:hypothetical protein